VTIRVTGLFIYPVKSLRGLPADGARLRPTGLRGDRHWMVLRENGRFLTQRECPALARISTTAVRGGVALSVAGQAPLFLPLRPRQGRRLHTAVWDDPCEVVDQGDEAGRWLDAALGGALQGLRLVRMAPGYRRPQPRPERYGQGVSAVFADGAPLLLTSEASLERLNEALAQAGAAAVTMDRFRPNVVLRGFDPFAEHRIRLLQGPGYVLAPRYPCQRCSVTTVDQQTGATDPAGEPWQTLRRLNPMPGNEAAPAFGENAVLVEGAGVRIRLGDVLTPVFRNDGPGAGGVGAAG